MLTQGVGRHATSPGAPTAAARTEATLLARSVNIAFDAARLPAIATLDWCELAAGVLCNFGEQTIAGVLLGQVRGDGTVGAFEAAGVAARGVGSSESERASLLSERRWRLESEASIGWKPDEVVVQAGLAGGRLTQMTSRPWDEVLATISMRNPRAVEVLVGAVAVGDATPDRRLAAYVALHDERALVPGLTDVFLAVLEKIGEAASRAIGQHRPGRSFWITPKEQEVLNRLILGYSVREIAAELGRSPHTMHDHVKSLHRKLGATSRGDLIARALGYQRAPSGPATIAAPSPFQLAEVRLRPSASAPKVYRAGA